LQRAEKKLASGHKKLFKENNITEAKRKILQLAYTMYSKKEFITLDLSNDMNKLIYKSGLFLEVKKYSNTRRQCKFVHKTFLEYFCCLSVLSENEKKEEKMTNIITLEPTERMFICFLGILTFVSFIVFVFSLVYIMTFFILTIVSIFH
jgi:hypothetical protein